jgi:predicted nucleic acid-binding protein
VHDARLVAVMRTHGVTHILTFNVSDFVRYQSMGIVPVHPSSV